MMGMHRENGFVSAVIVAAGQSTRMGANKMLLELGSMTVFERTVRAFEESDCVDEIVVVSSQENMVYYRNIVKDKLLSKVTAIVVGGESRGESVRCGLRSCNRAADMVAIHDGARPLIKPETIDKAVQTAREYGAAAVGMRSKDSLKVIDSEDFAIGSVDRETTVSVQTPQVFRRDIIEKAHEKAVEDGFEGTDDCSLTERIGIKTKMIYLPYINAKLTDPFDVTVVTAALRERGKL